MPFFTPELRPSVFWSETPVFSVEQLTRYAMSVGVILVVSGLGYPLRDLIEPTNLVMLYLAAIVVIALSWGNLSAWIASFLGMIAFNLIFIPPYYTLAVDDAQYLITLFAMLFLSFLTGSLASRSRTQTQEARERAHQIEALYDLSQDLGRLESPELFDATLHAHLQQHFGEHTRVLPAQGDPPSAGSWIPLPVAGKVRRYLLIPGKSSDPERQQPFLQSILSQAAQVLERLEIASQLEEARLLEEKQRLQNALFSSISHDLRTPLASITGALSSLLSSSTPLNDSMRQLLLNTAWEQADRLNRLVSNLLEMSRIESGGLRLQREESDLQDLIGVALGHLESQLVDREIRTEIAADLPMVSLDFMLMLPVVVNLLENAHKYSPPEARIDLRVGLQEGRLCLEVQDYGNGIPPSERERIFEKFYRLPGETRQGTGLGLAICRSLVSAHGGSIELQAGQPQGTIVRVRLPVEEK